MKAGIANRVAAGYGAVRSYPASPMEPHCRVLPLYVHPQYRTRHRQGTLLRGVTLVLRPDVAGGLPRQGVTRLAATGVPMLGYVDLDYATRPVADILDHICRWEAGPVEGIFFDRAPTTPYAIGPVASAVSAARRSGLTEMILNPGLPPDPLYRDLGVAICTFEGTWADYRRLPDESLQPGDGYVVHDVPRAHLPAAYRLMIYRRAGFGLATDGRAPQLYDGSAAPLPALGAPR